MEPRNMTIKLELKAKLSPAHRLNFINITSLLCSIMTGRRDMKGRKDLQTKQPNLNHSLASSASANNIHVMPGLNNLYWKISSYHHV